MNYLAQINASQLDSVSSGIKLQFARTTLGPVITLALPYVFGIAGFALLIFIVFSGFSLMTSKGDERAVAAAKAKLTYAITGFVIIFLSYWIVQLVGIVLGIQIINTIF
jgi:hypothetical protein